MVSARFQESGNHIFHPVDVSLVDAQNQVDLSYFSENGEWKLTNRYVESTRLGPYSELKYTFTLERRSEFFIVSIFIPFIVLVMLNSIVFLLPADSGERMGYSMTCLLAIAVFLTLVSDSIPSTSKPISVLAYIIMFCLVLSTSIIILIIISLSFHHGDDDKPLPRCLRNIVLFFDTDRCCRRKKSNVICVTPKECEENVPQNKNETKMKNNSSVKDIGKSDKSNWKLNQGTVGMIGLRFRKPLNEEKPEPQICIIEEPDPEPEKKWKDFARLFDKFCFTFVLGCVILLGSVYFLITSGRL